MDRLTMLTKGKNIGPAKTAQEKLSFAKADLDRKKGELAGLRRKRAEESSKNQPRNRHLEYFDDQIVLLKKEIDDLPYKIDVLEEQLLTSKTNEFVKKNLFDSFMAEISTEDIQKKSRLLLKQLKAALKTNEELQEFHRRRVEVEKNTGRRIMIPNVCGGFNSLKILAGICEGENDGTPRTFTRWASVVGEDII
ncbi:hypothetical protein KAR91_61535 [Candidatus Pacearchaeota archaeon]|nr:hypothetical protein [Candidatus Pacearchaeota archaeon]